MNMIWERNIVNCANTTAQPLDRRPIPPVVAILISNLFFFVSFTRPTLLPSLATLIISKQINVAHMWHHFMRRVYLLYGIIVVASPPRKCVPFRAQGFTRFTGFSQLSRGLKWDQHRHWVKCPARSKQVRAYYEQFLSTGWECVSTSIWLLSRGVPPEGVA